MKIGPKIFVLCLTAAVIGAAPAQQEPKSLTAADIARPRQIVSGARSYIFMVHGNMFAHKASELIHKYADPDITTVVADRREHVEDFINAGFDVWTSDDGLSTMRFLAMKHKGSFIVVDHKYIIDWEGMVTEDENAVYHLTNDLTRFCDTRAKKQYPKAKKPAPTQKPAPKKPSPAKKQQGPALTKRPTSP